MKRYSDVVFNSIRFAIYFSASSSFFRYVEFAASSSLVNLSSHPSSFPRATNRINLRG